MILEIWILKKDLEQLKKNCASFFVEDVEKNAIRYMTVPPKTSQDWICVHISLDDWTRLTDQGLLHE